MSNEEAIPILFLPGWFGALDITGGPRSNRA
jgi:hypothetical protein